MRKPEQLGPYLLRQEEGVFPLTGDTLALGRFATVHPGDRVCDLGCGSGALLLLLAGRAEGLQLTGLDTDGAAAALTGRNLADNALDGRALHCDVTRVGEQLKGQVFDLVVSNPPYFSSGSGSDGGRERMERTAGLADFIAAAGRLLRHGGRLALVHRSQRLTDLMCLLRAHRLEPKRMKLSGPCVWLEAVKDGRPGGLRLE